MYVYKYAILAGPRKTYMYTYVHTYIYTYINTYTYIHIHAYMHTHTHTIQVLTARPAIMGERHTCIHTYIHTYRDTHTHKSGADREAYYYGRETLFETHADIVEVLCRYVCMFHLHMYVFICVCMY
jgi:hypothetical protein